MSNGAPSELLALVARRIKALRAARGLTQDAVAEALGIAVKNVQRLESGRQNLTLRSLQSVADVLNVEPFELLTTAEVASRPGLSLTRALQALERLGNQVTGPDAPAPRGAVPVMTLQAAASRFGEAKDVQVTAWIKLKGVKPSQLAGRFVAQVTGDSMAPAVPNGALALFRSPVVGPLEGRVVVAQWREPSDADEAGAFVLKRVGAVEAREGGGLRLSLQSDNPDFPAIFVDAEDTGELRLLAELERVLWPLAR